MKVITDTLDRLSACLSLSQVRFSALAYIRVGHQGAESLEVFG